LILVALESFAHPLASGGVLFRDGTMFPALVRPNSAVEFCVIGDP